jgi:RNA polymerase sigma-70 factor, ECF subfamily
LTEPADRDLPAAAALARRDRAAWTQAFDRHGGDVYALIAYLVRGNQALAEELHQEVWLSAIDRIEQFSPDRGAMRDWLLAIARNCVREYYRRQQGRRTFASDDPATQAAIDADEAALLPEDLLEQLERRDAVRASLILLPHDAREVLFLKYVSGLPVNEIATRTGRTPKAIESLLSRARSRLRKLLAWYFPAPQGEERK